MNIDISLIARELKLSPEKVENTLRLLEDGNTIPFITRFRKDQTGGLNEQLILAVKQKASQLKALADRKSFVIKSLESQGRLTDELQKQIDRAGNSRAVEDIYLPFKPKKQSRAQVARQQGLEPLAEEVLEGKSPEIDLAKRATDFVRVDKGLKSVDDVIQGVADLIAEKFSENKDFKVELRSLIWDTGSLTTSSISSGEKQESSEPDLPKQKPAEQKPAEQKPAEQKSAEQSQGEKPVAAIEVLDPVALEDPVKTGDQTTAEVSGVTAETQNGIDQQSDQTKAETATTNTSPESKFVQDGDNLPSSSDLSNKESQSENATDVDGNDSSLADNQVDKADQNTDEEQKVTIKKTETEPTGKKKKKKKKKKKVDDPFKDYHDFRHALKQIPHYRMLAINRGERANKLKVKIEFEHSKPSQLAESRWVPETHPLQQFLQACAADALTRLVIPSLEREIRRELTEAAENHAVEVFACNLKNLLLQPPIRNKMVLAIDPGFKRGCSIAVVDRCGQLLGTSHIYVVGNQNRKSDGKKKLAALVQKHDVDVIAIGNGAGCRETEKMVSDTIAESLTGSNLKYTIVNEAGASFYSTSEIGREEFPDLNPSFRSAISIARRLQDPLSELVKISPANIGVGLYQHDVKAKHLSESLDEVVTFCVNKVGVNVNSASLSLLKHVSGLNSLTARRLVEYRSEKGPFQNRSQLKEVNGIGDSTFVQAAGFLRIHGGDSPLDESGIHPESYDLAAQVVQKVDATIDDLFPSQIKPDLCKCEKVDSASSGNGDIAQDPQVDLIADSNAAETSPAENQSNPESRSSEHGKTENEPSSEGEVTSTSVASESESESDSKSQAEQVPAADAANSNTEDVTAEAAVGPVETTSDDQVDVKSAATLAKSQSTTDPPELTAAQKIRREKREEIEKKLSRLRIQDLAKDLDQGELLVRDIVLALKRPQWDPRVKTAKPIFRSGIIKLEDLKPEMQLEGQVVNVVDFGVFVDIGLGDSSLIHVSQLSNKFIRDPHRKFAIGDVLQVWVTEVDIERRRIKLTAVPPGTKVGRKPNSRKNSRSKSGQNSRQKSGSDSRFARKDKRRSGSKESRKQRSQHSRNRTSKPVKPITDGMLKGKEPMRSFSDLAQFVTQKKDPKESDGKGKSK